ncbi:hypothetical protein GF396_02000 [Candidatus Pacearchaeota archaeon]|nr:hypothetical protein [Candidatus Pacearchaeota archaeon]
MKMAEQVDGLESQVENTLRDHAKHFAGKGLKAGAAAAGISLGVLGLYCIGDIGARKAFGSGITEWMASNSPDVFDFMDNLGMIYQYNAENVQAALDMLGKLPYLPEIHVNPAGPDFRIHTTNLMNLAESAIALASLIADNYILSKFRQYRRNRWKEKQEKGLSKRQKTELQNLSPREYDNQVRYMQAANDLYRIIEDEPDEEIQPIMNEVIEYTNLCVRQDESFKQKLKTYKKVSRSVAYNLFEKMEDNPDDVYNALDEFIKVIKEYKDIKIDRNNINRPGARDKARSYFNRLF